MHSPHRQCSRMVSLQIKLVLLTPPSQVTQARRNWGVGSPSPDFSWYANSIPIRGESRLHSPHNFRLPTRILVDMLSRGHQEAPQLSQYQYQEGQIKPPSPFRRSWSQAMQRNETNYRAKLSVNHKIMEKLHYELIHRFKVEKLST
jgi:hypothetical protein